METIIQVHQEGKFFIAVDLVTNVADQGLTEAEAVKNLKKGLEGHYRSLLELTPQEYKTSLLHLGFEKYVKTTSNLS